MIGLTKRQAELLAFIQDYQRENGGVSPSLEEMRDGIGSGSKNGATWLRNALEERGYIRRLKNRARAIEILRPAEPRLHVIMTPADCERLFERNREREPA